MMDTSHDPVLGLLNPAQFEAVTIKDGPCLIIAGAGSGKTRVITRRIAWLIRDCGVRPEAIFATTFTNKAAEEMKFRVLQLTPGIHPSSLRMGTFHSQCALILRREAEHVGLSSSFVICDENDQLRAIRHVMRQKGIDSKVHSPAQFLWQISQAKIQLLSSRDMQNMAMEEAEEQAAEVRADYDRYLSESNAVDFDDLISHTVTLFRNKPQILEYYQNRFRYILVDEYQDTNLSQFEFIHLLAAGHQNLMVVGDEDQSIYGWRGADIKNILEFQKHYPTAKVVRLEQNYRSTKKILEVANTVISNNTERLGKNLFTDDDDETPVYLLSVQRETDEAEEIAAAIRTLVDNGAYRKADIAVFYRANALSRSFEEALRHQNIDYRVVGGTRFYDRIEVRDLIAYMQLVQDTNNTLALNRILNVPRRGVGGKAMQSLYDCAVQNGINEYQVLNDSALRAGVFSGRARAEIEKFVDLVSDWQEFASVGKSSDLMRRIIEDTAYCDYLKSGSTEMEANNRIENLDELCSGIKELEAANPGLTLGDWLERVSLTQATDDIEGGEQGKVSLMTMHAAKGLEFDVVFLCGMEDTIFPSIRAVLDGNLEEERRLFYVGITRARKKLVLSRSTSRMLYGQVRYNLPSKFLMELPQTMVTEYSRKGFCQDSQAECSEVSGSVITAKPFQTRNYSRGVLPMPTHQGVSSGSVGKRAKYTVGRKVRHPILGEGLIVEVVDSAQPSITVCFNNEQTMQLLTKYAKLEVLDDSPAND